MQQAATETANPEQAVAPRVQGPRVAAMDHVRMAPGPGGEALVYWHDNHDAGHDDFAGTRIDTTAAPTDADGHFSGYGDLKPGDLGWNGGAWLLAYYDNFADKTDAQPLGTTGATMGNPATLSWQATAIASDGSDFLLVGAQDAVVDATGATIASSTVAGAAAAWDGAKYWVVAGTSSVTATPVSGTTAQATGAAIAVATAQDPAIACGGGTCLVAWSNPSTFQIQAATLAPNGTLGTTASVTSSFGRWPSVVYSGGEFWVAWHGDDGVDFARVTTAGVVIDTNGVMVSSDSGPCCNLDDNAPHLAPTTDGVLAAWIGKDGEVHGAAIHADGTVGSETLISQFASEQIDTTIASDGSQFLAAWYDSRDGAASLDVYAAPLGLDGAPTAAPFMVPSAHDTTDNLLLAWTGTSWLVATAYQASSLTLSQFSTDGTILGTTTLPYPDDLRGLVSAGDGTALVLTRSKLQFIDATGAASGSAIAIPNATTNPAAAWTGTSYLLAWGDQVLGVQFAYVSPGDTTISGTSLDNPEDEVAVACSPSDCMVVAAGIQQTSQVTGIRFAQGGTPVAISVPLASEAIPENPSIAWDGSRYVLAWLDYSPATPQIFAAAIDATNTATLIGANYLADDVESHHGSHPFAAAVPGVAAIAYTRYLVTDGPGRAFAITIQPSAPGQDGTPGGDAGTRSGAKAGGCCDTGGAPPASALVVALLLVRRRRRARATA